MDTKHEFCVVRVREKFIQGKMDLMFTLSPKNSTSWNLWRIKRFHKLPTLSDVSPFFNLKVHKISSTTLERFIQKDFSLNFLQSASASSANFSHPNISRNLLSYLTRFVFAAHAERNFFAPYEIEIQKISLNRLDKCVLNSMKRS